jgi:hypothetical protein
VGAAAGDPCRDRALDLLIEYGAGNLLLGRRGDPEEVVGRNPPLALVVLANLDRLRRRRVDHHQDVGRRLGVTGATTGRDDPKGRQIEVSERNSHVALYFLPGSADFIGIKCRISQTFVDRRTEYLLDMVWARP